jgi:hypothetical protein
MIIKHRRPNTAAPGIHLAIVLPVSDKGVIAGGTLGGRP